MVGIFEVYQLKGCKVVRFAHIYILYRYMGDEGERKAFINRTWWNEIIRFTPKTRQKWGSKPGILGRARG